MHVSQLSVCVVACWYVKSSSGHDMVIQSHVVARSTYVCVCVFVRVHARAHTYVCTCELALGCAIGRVRMRVSVNHGHDIRLNNRGTHSYPSGVAKTTASPMTMLFEALAWWNRQYPSCKHYCKPYTYVHLQY